MSSLPELSEVLHVLSPIEDRYFNLGIHLGIKIQQLKIIERNHPDTSRRLTETISLWQENSTGECSWSTLAKAVERIRGYNRLAEELRKHDITNDLMEADSRESKDESGYSSNSDSNDSSGSEAECGCASKTPYSDGYPNPAMHRVAVPVLKEKSKASSQNEIPLKKQKRSYFTNDKQNSFGENTQHSEDAGYSSKCDSTSGDSTGSEIEHFDKVPGCGCDKPCSIYTLCAGGCPKPTSTKVGVVRKRVEGRPEVEDVLLPEEEGEEEEYAEKFEKETRQMRVQFAVLVSDTCDSLKKRNVATADLILFLQHASPVALKPRIDEMTKATSLAQVLTIVTGQTCSWFDYEMMTVLINRFGDDGDKKRLKQYEANFYKFAEQRLPKGKKHIEVGSGARVGGKQLVIKIDKEWDEVNFSDLKKIRENLASLLEVRSRDLYLADIREGCIMMTFMITEELARRLPSSRSCLSSSQVKFLKGEGVISLRCGKLSWRTAGQMKVKMVTQTSPASGWRFKLFPILDLRVMMTVMLLLALVLAGFSGVLVCMQAGRLQVNNDRTHAKFDVFTLHSLQVNTTHNVSSLGSSGPLIARPQAYWDSCPAYLYLPTKMTRQRNVNITRNLEGYFTCGTQEKIGIIARERAHSSGGGQVNYEGPSPSLEQLHELVNCIDRNWTNYSREHNAEVSLYCFHCSRVLIIRTADVRYTRDDEHLLVWNHIDIMLAMHQMYMMVTSNKFDPFHEVMNPNVLGSNNCDDCVRWHLCGQTCHYSKMITMRWEYDHQPKWQKYVILKNKTGTLNESPSKMKVQLYKSKIKVHIYSMPFEDGSCALRRRDVRTALMFKKINNNGCSTETDLRVDDILLLYSAALNNSNDLQSHRAFIMINHQTSTSWWSQSPHDRLIEQWYVGQIQRHPMLNCSHGYTNNYSIMIYMEIRFQVSHVFPLQPNLQYIFPTCYKTKEKQPTPCGREDSYSHEQHLQLFKDARSFVELNSIYCSLLTQFRLEQSEYCKGHNFMAIQHHYEAQEVLTDTQIHTCNLMLATCINGTLLMDMKWNTRFYTPYHYKILFYSAKYTNEHSLSQNNQN